MDFSFSAEQEELRRTVRDFLAARASISETRRLMSDERGYDEDVWKQMAAQLGLPSLVIPEKYDGAGFGFVELVVVLEEMGRALYAGPFFSTVALGVMTLLHAADEAARATWLPRIAAGDAIATLALNEEDGTPGLQSVTTRAREDAGEWLLDGTKMFVLDGHVADVLFVIAQTSDGIGVFEVDAGASGLTRSPLQTMDATRRQARIELSATPGRLVSEPGDTQLMRVLDLAAIALAAEQVGGAQRCLEMAVDYAKQRVQFGRPIGSFQAIKHKCADVLLDVESAKSAAYYAGWAASVLDDELPVLASMAKAYCSDAYFHAAAENIQIHGGIGFTWEHDAHLYFKRAKSSALLFGDPSYHRELVAQRVGI